MQGQIDPVAFRIFGLEIAWYGILIALAVLIGAILALRQARRIGIDEDQLINLLLIVVPAALLGARFYYVIFSWDYYKNNFSDILNFRQGGLAIHGGIITAVIIAIIYTKIKGMDFWKVADACSPSLILGQAIGRWGNYINQEAYGRPTDLPWAIVIDGVNVHPTFLYESLWNFMVFIFLLWYRRKNQKVKGEIFALYIGLYSFIRFFVEGLRTDSLMLGPIRVGQLVSIVGILGGVILFLYRRKVSIEN